MSVQLIKADPHYAGVITYGVVTSSLGALFIAATDLGLCWVALIADEKSLSSVTLADELALLRKAWPKTLMVEDANKVDVFKDQVTALSPHINVHIRGSEFQLQVWRALLTIPHGQTTTYGAIAAAIGNPKANQAVGNAVGANPIGIIIPCHRVLPKSGALGGFRWGMQAKQKLLDRERQIIKD